MVVFNKVYHGWARAIKRTKFVSNKWRTGYIRPATDVTIGSKGCRCGIENVRLCKAYCCGVYDDIEINPLEIAIISNTKNIAPVDFVDYCALGTSELKKGPNYANPLFVLKKNQKCQFNLPDLRCGIYDIRPMTCRSKPYYLDGLFLTQQKICAGYKCGNKLSQDEFDYIYEIAKMSKIFSKLKFFVDFNDFEAGNSKKILQDTFTRLDIPFYHPVKTLDLESICEKMKLISDFEFKLTKYKMAQNEILEILTREMIKPVLIDPVGPQTDISAIVNADQEAKC